MISVFLGLKVIQCFLQETTSLIDYFLNSIWPLFRGKSVSMVFVPSSFLSSAKVIKVMGNQSLFFILLDRSTSIIQSIHFTAVKAFSQSLFLTKKRAQTLLRTCPKRVPKGKLSRKIFLRRRMGKGWSGSGFACHTTEYMQHYTPLWLVLPLLVFKQRSSNRRAMQRIVRREEWSVFLKRAF